MKETMTVHKALSELKILTERIDKEISRLTFVATAKNNAAKVNGVAVDTFIKDVKDKYKSVTTLINRRNAIKRAVTRSNAVTEVSIGGQTYTVAEAIDMKAMGMNYLKGILSRMENQWHTAQNLVERENGEKLDRRADEYVKSLYENADMKNMSEEIRKVRETFVESQSVNIVDPLNVQKQMADLNDGIDAFMSDVDSALSVSNALTAIEVEYETV